MFEENTNEIMIKKEEKVFIDKVGTKNHIFIQFNPSHGSIYHVFEQYDLNKDTLKFASVKIDLTLSLPIMTSNALNLIFSEAKNKSLDFIKVFIDEKQWTKELNDKLIDLVKEYFPEYENLCTNNIVENYYAFDSLLEETDFYLKELAKRDKLIIEYNRELKIASTYDDEMYYDYLIDRKECLEYETAIIKRKLRELKNQIKNQKIKGVFVA